MKDEGKTRFTRACLGVYLPGAWRDFRLAVWGPNNSLATFFLGGGSWPLWPPLDPPVLPTPLGESDPTRPAIPRASSPDGTAGLALYTALGEASKSLATFLTSSRPGPDQR